MTNQTTIRAVGKYFRLFIAIIIMVCATQLAHAQSEDLPPNSGYFVNTVVTGVNGNIVECTDGFNADLSQLQNARGVEAGDRLGIFGILSSDADHASVLTAITSDVLKQRDVEFDGKIQAVNGNTITVLNQQVVVNEQTVLQNVDHLEAGQYAFTYAESRDEGFVAYRVIVLPDGRDNDIGVSAFIKAINGLNLELGGGFHVNITQDNLHFLEATGSVVGSRVFVNLRKLPKGKVLKTPFVGIVSLELQIGGELQAVDAQNRTVTVLNKQIPLAKNARVYDARLNRVDLAAINISEVERVTVLLDKDGDNLSANTVFIIKKE